MREFVVGTSGHIDHGKTSIIKALTGIDTDRLLEEKEKGISIDIGFSYIIEDDIKVGVIDNPGHERFIKNMLTGVSNLDYVLLVIAADDGIMPQTVEHFNILKSLNITNGLVVLNKVDKVDESRINEVVKDIKKFTTNSFLENSKIVQTSIMNEESIITLKNEILKELVSIKNKKSTNSFFRMAIDRCFTIKGHGTVITGTTLGSVKIGDKLEILPHNVLVNVKNIQNHNKDVITLDAHNRCALNITYNDKVKFRRGDVIASPNTLSNSKLIDVKITAMSKVKNGMKVRVHHHAKEVIARLKLLDSDVLELDQTGYAQLILEEEIIALNNDICIIRSLTPVTTIASALIINIDAKSVKRFDQKHLNLLKNIDDLDVSDVIDTIIKENSKNFNTVENTMNLIVSYANYEQVFNSMNTYRIINNTVLHNDFLKSLKVDIENELNVYHENNKQKIGMNLSDLRAKYFSNAKNNVANSIIEELGFKLSGAFVSLPNFSASLSGEEENVRKKIIDLYMKEIYKPPTVDEVKKEFSDKKMFDNVFSFLTESSTLTRLDGNMFILTSALKNVEDYMMTLDKIELASVRDFTNSSRKYVVAILEYFDKMHITKRIDNYRVVIKK